MTNHMIGIHFMFCWLVRCVVNSCVCASGFYVDLSSLLFLFPNNCQLKIFVFFFLQMWVWIICLYGCYLVDVQYNFHFVWYKIIRLSYVYWTVHHPDSWIKIDQLAVTCFIVSLFTAQHVSNVSTSIFRSLRLIVDLFHVLYCSGSMCVGVTLWFGWVVWYP